MGHRRLPAGALRRQGALLPAASNRLATGCWISDDYLTEYRPPDDAATADIRADLAIFRGLGPRPIPARALVLGGFGLDAVDRCGHRDLDRTDPTPLRATVRLG